MVESQDLVLSQENWEGGFGEDINHTVEWNLVPQGKLLRLIEETWPFTGLESCPGKYGSGILAMEDREWETRLL